MIVSAADSIHAVMHTSSPYYIYSVLGTWIPLYATAGQCVHHPTKQLIAVLCKQGQ